MNLPADAKGTLEGPLVELLLSFKPRHWTCVVTSRDTGEPPRMSLEVREGYVFMVCDGCCERVELAGLAHPKAVSARASS